MSDTDRFVSLLAEFGRVGLHSHETRRRGISGNPSQRAKDAVSAGTPIRKRRENVGRRPGCRFWLEEFAPVESDRVVPNKSSDAPASHEQEAPDAASVGRTSLPAGGALFDMPEPTTSAVTGRVT